MLNLKAKPFYLDDAAVSWVSRTLAELSDEEKLGQLFVPIGYSGAPGYLDNFIHRYHIGGIMYRCGDAKEMQQTHRYLQEHSRIPLLIGANLEEGGTGIAVDGTCFGKQLQAAATGDPRQAYQLGKISCAEGHAVGCNWAFAPVVDIDRNWRNPITNVRTYGSDPAFVLACGKEYLRAAKEENVLVLAFSLPNSEAEPRHQNTVVELSNIID